MEDLGSSFKSRKMKFCFLLSAFCSLLSDLSMSASIFKRINFILKMDVD